MMRTKLLVGACAAAVCTLWFGQAAADPTATLGGGYSYTDLGGSGGHLNDWSVNGSVAVPVAPNWTVQGDGSYDNFTSSAGGGSAHTTEVGGSAYWNNAKGRIGLTAGYNEFGAGGSSVHFNNYGAFGVLYATPQVTLGLKGGALNGASGLHNASYVGGEVVGYVMPNLALSGTIDYASINSLHLTTYGAHAEDLVSQTTPIAVTGGYTYTEIFGAHLNTYMVGLKVYFGGKGSLVDHHRSGDETWGTKQSALTFLF